MKKLAILIVAGLMASCSFAQKTSENEIPETVKSAFKKLYPTVTNAKWDKEGEKYEASFDLNKKDNSVLFDSNGNVEETEVEIGLAELPVLAKEYITKNYSGQKISEAAMITDAKGIIKYEAEIKGRDLIFDAQGNFVKEIKN